MAVKWKELAFTENVAGKTSANWSKSIGSGGDYATWAAMIADMPDLIAHTVTVTIKAGTTLTETCELKNKQGITNVAQITVEAEKYFPTSGAIPTADSATSTTLRDAALATAALGNDYFNGCWVFIVDGTGTDNGFVPITDYVDATGDVVVASWPGTQPDVTSRYLIVGALFDGENARNIIDATDNTCMLYYRGIGFTDPIHYGIINRCNYVQFFYCAFDKALYSGIQGNCNFEVRIYYCGLVNNNSSNNTTHGGIAFVATNRVFVNKCGISDNSRQGVVLINGSFGQVNNCFGNGNGTWGIYCFNSGSAVITGTECSGSSGNHSDPGTAGTAGADQASAY